MKGVFTSLRFALYGCHASHGFPVLGLHWFMPGSQRSQRYIGSSFCPLSQTGWHSFKARHRRSCQPASYAAPLGGGPPDLLHYVARQSLGVTFLPLVGIREARGNERSRRKGRTVARGKGRGHESNFRQELTSRSSSWHTGIEGQIWVRALNLIGGSQQRHRNSTQDVRAYG